VGFLTGATAFGSNGFSSSTPFSGTSPRFAYKFSQVSFIGSPMSGMSDPAASSEPERVDILEEGERERPFFCLGFNLFDGAVVLFVRLGSSFVLAFFSRFRVFLTGAKFGGDDNGLLGLMGSSEGGVESRLLWLDSPNSSSARS
jgi:hypothetical protein